MVFLQGRQQRATLNEKGLREHAILAVVMRKPPKDENLGDRDMSQKEEQRLGKDVLVPWDPKCKESA